MPSDITFCIFFTICLSSLKYELHEVFDLLVVISLKPSIAGHIGKCLEKFDILKVLGGGVPQC